MSYFSKVTTKRSQINICDLKLQKDAGCYRETFITFIRFINVIQYTYMTTGHGMQSLIPPKKNDGEIKKEEHNQNTPKPITENIFSEYKHAPEKEITERVVERDYSQKQKLDIKPESVFQIEIEKIKSNPYQPRKTFNKEDLEELAQSISEFGVIQPITVSKIVKEKPGGADVEYQLIAGERRLMASKIAGLERIPAIIKKVDTGKVRLEMALIENIQRSDLNALDAGKAYARLQDEFGLTQREIAVRMGKSREVIANTLRLLNLPSHMQTALAEGKINESQARGLLSFENITEQQKAFEQLLERKMIPRHVREKGLRGHPQTQNPEELHLERQLEEKLGAPVKIIKNKDKGRIVIEFYSQDEWQSIIDSLLKDEIN